MNIDRLEKVFNEYVEENPDETYNKDDFHRWLDDKFGIYIIPDGETIVADLTHLTVKDDGSLSINSIEGGCHYDGQTVQRFAGSKRNYIFVYSNSPKYRL